MGVGGRPRFWRQTHSGLNLSFHAYWFCDVELALYHYSAALNFTPLGFNCLFCKAEKDLLYVVIMKLNRRVDRKNPGLGLDKESVRVNQQTG